MSTRVQEYRQRAADAEPYFGRLPTGVAFARLLQAVGLTFEQTSRLLDVGVQTVRRYATGSTSSSKALDELWSRKVLSVLLADAARLSEVGR